MNSMFMFARRNCLCFFRDRASVVFSLMSALIVVMLYLLFLRNMMVESYPGYPGMDHLIDAWVLSGILGIVSVTTCAGALQIMVADNSEGRSADFLVAPVRPYEIAGGYILGTFVVGFIIGLIILVISVIYLTVTGCPLTATGIATSVLLLVPSTFSGCIIMYALTSFIKSQGAFSGFFTVISVVIGFIAGIYMPMGSMPVAMQSFSVFIPATQMCSLFRQSLAGAALDQTFAGVPAETVAEFRKDMGFDLFVSGNVFGNEMMIMYVVAVSAVFFLISIVRIIRR